MRQDMFQQFLMTCDPCWNLKLTIPCHCKKLRPCPASNFPFATCQSRQKSQLEPNISYFSWVWKTVTSMLFRDGGDGPCCGHNSFKFHWSLLFSSGRKISTYQTQKCQKEDFKKMKRFKIECEKYSEKFQPAENGLRSEKVFKNQPLYLSICCISMHLSNLFLNVYIILWILKRFEHDKQSSERWWTVLEAVWWTTLKIPNSFLNKAG